MREPRDPLLKVLYFFFKFRLKLLTVYVFCALTHVWKLIHSNDPSAGSPTETLLRLLRPLNDQVCLDSPRHGKVAPPAAPILKPH